MVGSDLITIVIVLGIGYWLFSTGKLDEIFSGLQLGGSAGPGTNVSVQGADGVDAVGNAQTGADGQSVVSINGKIYRGNGEQAMVSGENSGAMVNGKCVGDPAQCAKAQRLLEQIS